MSHSQPQPLSDNVVHAMAGAAGGMASMALTYPLINLSTRCSIDKSGKASQIQTFKRILKEEGVTGFYSGLGSAMFGISVTQGVYYYWYELIKAIFEADIPAGPSGNVKRRAMTTLESMGAGAVAGIATSVITNPIWVVNTRLMVKEETSATSTAPPTKLTFLQVISKIFKSEGLAGFFKGLIPALFLVSNPIIQYTVFEKLKERMLKTRKSLSGLDFFLMGAVSKLAATGSTYPYIVVKSRMQSARDSYTSQLDAFRSIVKAEGVKGLYKGIESKLLQSVLTSAFLFAFKETFFSLVVGVLMKVGLRRKIGK